MRRGETKLEAAAAPRLSGAFIRQALLGEVRRAAGLPAQARQPRRATGRRNRRRRARSFRRPVRPTHRLRALHFFGSDRPAQRQARAALARALRRAVHRRDGRGHHGRLGSQRAQARQARRRCVLRRRLVHHGFGPLHRWVCVERRRRPALRQDRRSLDLQRRHVSQSVSGQSTGVSSTLCGGHGRARRGALWQRRDGRRQPHARFRVSRRRSRQFRREPDRRQYRRG